MSRIIKVTAVAALIGCLPGAACVDVRDFSGRWTGKIAGEEPVRAGFADTVRVEPLEIAAVNLSHVDATLTTTDGRFRSTALTPVNKAANDALATISFNGAPLKTYLLFAPLTSESAAAGPVQAVISLFQDDHVELRLIRANELFGVFSLNREDLP